MTRREDMTPTPEEHKQQIRAVHDRVNQCFHGVVRPATNDAVMDIGAGENETMLALWVALTRHLYGMGVGYQDMGDLLKQLRPDA